MASTVAIAKLCGHFIYVLKPYAMKPKCAGRSVSTLTTTTTTTQLCQEFLFRAGHYYTKLQLFSRVVLLFLAAKLYLEDVVEFCRVIFVVANQIFFGLNFDDK
jgi:hypothetical protein